ncbi:unnamed protein product [Oppiella nova]|uniref:ABC-2 type transporter transmembrane domain-containing protein n=1 Tax=Oppiella nova TaxID=334625 RepID=A0A7R9QL43_9ACAR|nr:unnamed protein product [Oppiella nova]CAG2167150.1 unnamed protein product [Oppiella nova]
MVYAKFEDSSIYLATPRKSSADPYETIHSLKYMDAVIEETLRLFPPLLFLNRVATEDYELKGTGITIKKDHVVHIPTYAMHRDPEYFADPEVFRPERFLTENIAHNPYTYLPWGAGPRNCLGTRLAQLEIKLALVNLVHRYVFHTTDKPLQQSVSGDLIITKSVDLKIERRFDEPTTGLDAFMAKSIVQVLKTMASEGRTVICTIHQPSSPVFQLFDSLLLMADGRVAFMGSIGDAKDLFSSQGLGTTRGTPTLNIPILGSGYKAGYWRQFITLLWRSYVTLIRNPQFILDRLAMYLINVFWMGIMFYNIGHAYSDASNIMGALIMVMGAICIPPMYFALVTLVDEMPLLYREHHDRTYAVLPYFLSTIMIQWRNVGNMSSADTTNTIQSTTTYTSGVEVIESQGFDESALMWCPFALMAWALVYMFVAYIGLCRKVRRKQ